MTGVAALALSAAFTSCSKSDELYNPEVVKGNEATTIVEKYNQAFTKYVGGTISPDQTWGFGGYSAGTRGVFANGNEWAANDRDDCKYRVPPVLTPEQKAVVIKYFQTVQNPDYQDPHWTNYFIQQVYKGGYAAGSNSSEKYTAADGNTKIVGSDNMDHLAAINGDFVDHNNNFNHGDCGEYGNVLDFKGTLTTVEETYPVNDATHRHPDKINLMTNSTTASFGYYNSNSSVRRTEYTGLVNFQTIIDKLGAEANCLNDGWNRSFMGFDFEMMIGESLYQKQNGEPRYAKISDIPGNAPQYIWDGTNVIKWYDYDSSWNKVYAEGYDEFIKVGGEKIPYLVTNKNMYAGNRLDEQTVLTNISQTNLKVYKDYSEDVKNVECLNLPLIKAAFEAGYYPTEDMMQTWVKVGGTADGYYSDWIVTLTEAKKYDTPTPPTPPSDPDDVCIIAEDLSASGDTDFDFNDVVFTVHYNTTTTATVTLYAAGGTLPLTVAGHEVHAEFGYPEADPETGLYKMINTGAKADVNNVATKSFDVTCDKSKRGNDITIMVDKGSKNEQGVHEPNWITLTATKGEPAAKLCVGVDFATGKKWCAERESIKTKYPIFSQWVASNPSQIWWY